MALYIIYIFWGPSRCRHCNQNQNIPSSNPSEAWLGLGTQHHYKAPNELCAKNVKRQRLTFGELAVLQIMDVRQQLLIV